MLDKKVKIIATTGPSTNSYETILELAKAGVDIFRVNLSHATEEGIKNNFTWIREAEKELGRPLAIMGDLAGPKIRIGDVVRGVELVKGDTITIWEKTVMGNKHGFSLNYPEIVTMIKPNTEIYIDDGAIKLRSTKKISCGIEAVVTVGGKLLPRKGFLAEGIALSKTGISEKDKASISMMIDLKVDAIALSFVQTPQDVLEVKDLLPKDSKMQLVAKIETAGGVKNAKAIIEVVDVLMVARGDLGLSVPLAQVPHIQKQLISLCLQKAKPVITATQMLESMINRSIPTRAEVTDVSNSILEGTDCVMLSAETASGQFPVETVETMVRIILEAVNHRDHLQFVECTVGDAVSAAVGKIADEINARLIVVFTESGTTARRISRHRHKEPIVALSPNKDTVHHLMFSWGVYPQVIKVTKNFEEMIQQAKEVAGNNSIKKLTADKAFVIAAGMPFGKAGTTNMILVEKA